MKTRMTRSRKSETLLSPVLQKEQMQQNRNTSYVHVERVEEYHLEMIVDGHTSLIAIITSSSAI